MRVLGQLIAYTAFAATIGYFSFLPAYSPLDEGLALVKLSFSHGGKRVEECRTLTPDEIAALPPNERRPNTCARERQPVVVEMLVDGQIVYSESLRAAGIAKDGPSTAYATVELPVGEHRLDVRLRDSARESGFDYERSTTLTFLSRQIFVIDFHAQSGGFEFPGMDTGAAGEPG